VGGQDDHVRAPARPGPGATGSPQHPCSRKDKAAPEAKGTCLLYPPEATINERASLCHNPPVCHTPRHMPNPPAYAGVA